MRKYTIIHGLEMQDNNKKTMNKLTVQAVLTESKKGSGSDEEIKKIENCLMEMVDNYIKDE